MQILRVEPRGRRSSIVRVSGVGSSVGVEIYKVRHFRCRSLKGKGSRSGIRIVYAYLPDENKIVFIEAYTKQKQSNHNKGRIYKYFHKTKGLYYQTKKVQS